MKKLINIALLAIIAITFANCTEQEQSRFEVSDIPTHAKLIGRLAYDEGIVLKNNKYVQSIKPAANKMVYLEIENATLTPNNTEANGYTVLTTTTNEDGEYEFNNIPVVYNGTNATIRVESFLGEYQSVEGVHSGKPEYNTTEGMFVIEPQTVTLKPNDFKINDAVYVMEGRNVNSIYNKYEHTSTFYVQVGQNNYSEKDGDHDKFFGPDGEYSLRKIDKKYKGANKVDVIVTIGENNYVATTNSSGRATFIIPAEKRYYATEALVDAIPYCVNNFKYICREYNEEKGKYQNKAYTLTGCVSTLNGPAERGLSISHDHTPTLKLPMVLIPEGDSHGYTPDEWLDIVY